MGLRICVPLGALFAVAIEVLEGAGVDVAPLRDAGRRLIVESPTGTTFITTRPSDVPTYVESGAADIGIVGKDVLRERSPDVYELLDLRFGECRMVYATRAGQDPTAAALEHLGVVRVATKYPVSATGYFTATGRQAEVVKVNGSVELAPLVGLAHGIVDLVATGRTLRENGLVEREEIFHSSARLIANRVSQTLRAEELDGFVQRMAQARR
jgi:ATP phosphoribosyltransferase